MRAVYLVPLFVILAVAGAVYGLGRSPALPTVSAPRPSTSPAVRPPPPPPGPPRQAQEAASPDPATDGLTCIQNALGGVRAFAGVSSLRILGTTKPTATTSPGPVPNRIEIGVVFPDRYKRHYVGTGRYEGLTFIAGFNGSVLLSYPEPPDKIADWTMRAARRDFLLNVLMRLPRRLAGVRLSERMMREAGQERLALDAYGSDGLAGTLLADPGTCMPVAVEYAIGSNADRVDLAEFRRFGGILFPTVLRTTRNGQPWTDEYVSEVQVNTPIEEAFFRR